MKTTHQVGRELLALPDVPLHIEYWCRLEGDEPIPQMTEWDPQGTAILRMGKPPPPKPFLEIGGHFTEWEVKAIEALGFERKT